VHNSLISVGQLCDSGYDVTFTQEQVTVSRDGKCVMYGSRDPRSRLWRVDLKKKFETKNVQCNHAHDNSNQKDLINYLHAACFSPVKSTWIAAIKNGHFTLWPGLTEHAVEKHLSKSAETPCKINQIKGAQSNRGGNRFGSRYQNPLRVCRNNRCRTNIH
jgi:hypothetical protein